MIRTVFRAALILFATCSFMTAVAGAEDFPLVVESAPLTPAEQRMKFHLPPGFEIQLVAAEPDVRKPINMNFDHAGRLFFSQSIEYPFAVRDSRTPRDTVRVIEGIGGDGRPAKVRTAVEGLNIPIGVLPLSDQLLVFSIPNIYSCRDEDGDGVYEKREVLFGPFDQRDTHGLNNGFTRGLDGWIYACHGFSNDSHVKGRDGHEVHMNSGNTYRFRADGSRIEHYTHGQVNPFGLCFDPAANLYSADCHTMPAYMLLHGGYYPSFGKPHDGLGFAPEIMHHSHGSTAIAGIVYYAAKQFPAEYRDTLFIGNPVTHRVNHDKLEWHGSSPVAIEQPDFITCDDPWFRPVDLKLGPDGALYIADFYNRIIGHYEVDLHHPGRDRERGRIWRVVYTGTKDKPVEPPKLPDLTKLDLDELVAKLGDGNFVVRTMATHEIIDRFEEEAAPAMTRLLESGQASSRARAQAAWILARQKTPNETFLRLLADDDWIVRTNAVRALAAAVTSNRAEDSNDLALAFVTRWIDDKQPMVRRAAVEGFGALSEKLIGPLLDVWKGAPAGDAQLIHAIRIALRDGFLKEGIYERWAAKELSRDRDNRERIADISLGIPTDESAEFVLSYINDVPQAARFDEMLAHAMRYLPAERLPQALNLAKRLRAEPLNRQRDVVAVIHQALLARGMKTPEEITTWANDVARRLLASNRERQIVRGAELAREMKLLAVLAQLEELVAGTSTARVRTIAIDACVATDPAGSVAMLAQLAGRPAEPMSLRQKAAQALSSINSEAAHREILTLLTQAPSSLAGDLATGIASAETAQLLIDAIENGRASAHVLRSPQVAARLKQIKNDEVQERIAKLTAALPAIDERIQKMIASRIGGFRQAKADAASGKQVFMKTCAACHKVGGEGTKIGPELDGIGNRGAERLVEDILDPSRNVDQAFRTTLITTDDGQSINGLVLREEGQVLVLADNQGKEIRLPLLKIADRAVSPLSPMPANIAEQLGEPEFYDLLEFLLRQSRQGDKERGRQGEGETRREAATAH